ncbi:hypothetical protein BGZ50_001678 [Haplosporangium sp. Z 11]|nr:hypothetical protein BGZ50_001678 [Haplosporangium sp. Z 11]
MAALIEHSVVLKSFDLESLDRFPTLGVAQHWQTILQVSVTCVLVVLEVSTPQEAPFWCGRRAFATDLRLKTSCNCLPAIEKLSLQCHHLMDDGLCRALFSFSRLTRVKVCGTKFGTLAYRSLVRHFPILRELNIKFCLGTTSAMVRHALVSCPELRSFSADFVEARDVLGIAQDQEAE